MRALGKVVWQEEAKQGEEEAVAAETGEHQSNPSAYNSRARSPNNVV